MARPGVTYYDISRAAEAVKARGSEPTIDRVREQLGTGSKSTIAPLLKKWRNNKELNIEESETGLPSDLIRAVKSLRDRIQQESEEVVEQAKQDYQSRVQTLERSLADAQKELSAASNNEQNLNQQVEDLKGNCRQLTDSLNELQTRLTAVEVDRSAIQTRAQELKETIIELKEENRAVRDHFEHYQQRTAEDRQLDRDQFQSQLQQLELQVESLTNQLLQTQQEKNDYKRRYEGAQEHADKFVFENQELKRNLEFHNEKLKKLRLECENKASRITAFDESISELRTEVANLKEQLIHRRTALSSIDAELQNAREYADRVSDENKEITQEKAVLQGRLIQLQESIKK
ncbi:MAG: DNA-binding protein [Cellvibrionaceae bacterium]